MSARARVLQVFGASATGGGVEKWLLGLLRTPEARRLHCDLLVHTCEPIAYQRDFQALGARILRLPDWRNPFSYHRALLRLLRREGPYDVVHAHVHHFGGIVLRVAARAGVPTRIAHSHVDTRAVDVAARSPRRAYLSLARALVRRHASAGFACSEAAAESLFGPAWGADPRWAVLPYAVDLSSFARGLDRRAARRGLGLSDADFVVGHVGRIVPQKNHAFLLEVAAELFARCPEARLVLVGDGPLRGEVEARASRLGLRDRIVMTGARADVARLMSAMDAFVLPSRWEGTPIVLTEAQAAGLPTLAADCIPSSSRIVGGLVELLPLGAGPVAWSERLAALRAAPRPDRAACLRTVLASPLALPAGVAPLLSCYLARPLTARVAS